jgi:hypothetical protein
MRRLVLAGLVLAAIGTSAAGWERELKWDSGIWGKTEGRAEGRGCWFGNDFEVTPFAGYD